MRKHWTERLFVDKASIYQEQLEELFEQAIQQVEELQSLLSARARKRGRYRSGSSSK